MSNRRISVVATCCELITCSDSLNCGLGSCESSPIWHFPKPPNSSFFSLLFVTVADMSTLSLCPSLMPMRATCPLQPTSKSHPECVVENHALPEHAFECWTLWFTLTALDILPTKLLIV